MTKDEAWRVIEEARKWNAAQTSVSLAFAGLRTAEDYVLDAKREALRQAWLTVGDAAPKENKHADQ